MMPVCIKRGNGLTAVIGHARIGATAGVRCVTIPFVRAGKCDPWSGSLLTPEAFSAIETAVFEVVTIATVIGPGAIEQEDVILVSEADDPTILPGWRPSVFPWGQFPE